MAEQKKTTKTTKTTTTSSNAWGINKISFYVLGATAILYLISTVLSFFDLSFKIISCLQGIATAFAICIVAYIAWRYVRNKQSVWKILYVVFLLVVLIGIVIPMI